MNICLFTIENTVTKLFYMLMVGSSQVNSSLKFIFIVKMVQ